MALKNTLAELSGKGPASKNRVDILLDMLLQEKPEDFTTLKAALRDPSVRAVVLTKALRAEYGHTTVNDTSVRDWRTKNQREVTGL
jgi:tryptophan 2,3-dioxygenase